MVLSLRMGCGSAFRGIVPLKESMSATFASPRGEGLLLMALRAAALMGSHGSHGLLRNASDPHHYW
jgi:hypothetical protein